ncbi:MAG TPA: putative glycolipid-binding domain-containing protein [Thermomicrobiales bacterium]|jgi:hypothetical protein|nr:putative glycolipid-binding domain-containing protein [Thermomicrobiales bacterium]
MAMELMWQTLDAPGFEHVRLDDGHPGWDVYDSMVIREHDGQVRRGGYTLVVDKAWRTLEIRIMVEQAPGSMAALHLLANGEGVWADAEEHRIPELDGCVDVDIQWSPLTNTLPVRRLDLRPGEEQEIRVAYIELPSLTVRPVIQRYTRLNGGRVRYESETRDFARDLQIDEDGFVEHYPDLFRRSWPSASQG